MRNENSPARPWATVMLDSGMVIQPGMVNANAALAYGAGVDARDADTSAPWLARDNYDSGPRGRTFRPGTLSPRTSRIDTRRVHVQRGGEGTISAEYADQLTRSFKRDGATGTRYVVQADTYPQAGGQTFLPYGEVPGVMDVLAMMASRSRAAATSAQVNLPAGLRWPVITQPRSNQGSTPQLNGPTVGRVRTPTGLGAFNWGQTQGGLGPISGSGPMLAPALPGTPISAGAMVPVGYGQPLSPGGAVPPGMRPIGGGAGTVPVYPVTAFGAGLVVPQTAGGWGSGPALPPAVQPTTTTQLVAPPPTGAQGSGSEDTAQVSNPLPTPVAPDGSSTGQVGGASYTLQPIDEASAAGTTAILTQAPPAKKTDLVLLAGLGALALWLLSRKR